MLFHLDCAGPTATHTILTMPGRIISKMNWACHKLQSSTRCNSPSIPNGIEATVPASISTSTLNHKRNTSCATLQRHARHTEVKPKCADTPIIIAKWKNFIKNCQEPREGWPLMSKDLLWKGEGHFPPRISGILQRYILCSLKIEGSNTS